MKLEIYGRETCPYCVKAKELSQKLKDQAIFDEVIYHDFIKENIDRKDIEAKIGREIKTVPVVLINDQFIGGYSELRSRFPL